MIIALFVTTTTTTTSTCTGGPSTTSASSTTPPLRLLLLLLLLGAFVRPLRSVCTQPASLTTASGTAAPGGPFCPHQLIFEENFDTLDPSTWLRVSTFWTGGNGEFQWYTDSDRNSYVRNGHLVIQPTLTTDLPIYPDLETCGGITIDHCTTYCEHVCSADNIAPPVQSARLETAGRFAFKYGRIEIRAKLPTGDWLWPSLRLQPADRVYGEFPRSGELNVVESRGNTNYAANGQQIGVHRVVSLLQYGPENDNTTWDRTFMVRDAVRSLNRDFHVFQMTWAPSHISFGMDNDWLGIVHTADGGFFQRGGFAPPNIWEAGAPNAPFDQEFHVVLNLAVGGTNKYFPDAARNVNGKPWRNDGTYAMRDFWRGREQWLPTWRLEADDELSAVLLVDYVRVYAL